MDGKAPRVAGLEGLRGLAALYVAGFHCWLLTFPGFPASSGPAALGWLMYGRLAVVFFLVLSGFSLALSPDVAVARYARRRAWRILPPYWAALIFSVVVAATVVPASHLGPPTRHSVFVYGLLLQDIRSAPTPNGAFWSIAVEVELYVVFPLLVLPRRRAGVAGLLAVAFALVAAHGSSAEGANHLALHLAPVFVAGVAGASVRFLQLPWLTLSLLTGLPVLGLIVVRGSVWTVGHYYWIDLAVAPAMVFLTLAVAAGRPPVLTRVLDSRPVRKLGSLSFSLYLTHLPILMVVSRKVAGRSFWVTVVVGVPLAVLFAWLFAKVFEAPFQRYRSWRELAAALRPAPRRAEPARSGRG